MTIEELLAKLSYNSQRKVRIFADGKPARISRITVAPDNSIHIEVKASKPKPPSGRFAISRSDGFYLGSFKSDNHRISYSWASFPKTDPPLVDYATAERLVAALFDIQETDEYGRPYAYTIERVEAFPTGST